MSRRAKKNRHIMTLEMAKARAAQSREWHILLIRPVDKDSSEQGPHYAWDFQGKGFGSCHGILKIIGESNVIETKQFDKFESMFFFAAALGRTNKDWAYAAGTMRTEQAIRDRANCDSMSRGTLGNGATTDGLDPFASVNLVGENKPEVAKKRDIRLQEEWSSVWDETRRDELQDIVPEKNKREELEKIFSDMDSDW